jgi:hypothetical protein
VNKSPRALGRGRWAFANRAMLCRQVVGGATDTFDAWKSGKLPQLLAKGGSRPFRRLNFLSAAH